MKNAKEIRRLVHQYENILSAKDNNLTKSQIQRGEKIIAMFNAIFEGVGLAGIISAAFWYATAPIAPDGFKGPIATYTIALTTIASLIIAMPISHTAYRRLINNIEKCFLKFIFETNRLKQNVEELHFELLKLRTLFHNNDEYMQEVKSVIQCKVIETMALEICRIYFKIKHKRYYIKWDAAFSILLVAEDKTCSINSLTFIELLKDKELANIKPFRKAIINYTCSYNLIFASNQNFSTSQFKDILYASVAGITCIEVLLSIGWTVASILIGVKIINPISTQNWVVCALSCIVIGLLFGLGVYFGNVKQTKRHFLKEETKYWNNNLTHAKANINYVLTKKLLEQRTACPALSVRYMK